MEIVSLFDRALDRVEFSFGFTLKFPLPSSVQWNLRQIFRQLFPSHGNRIPSSFLFPYFLIDFVERRRYCPNSHRKFPLPNSSRIETFIPSTGDELRRNSRVIEAAKGARVARYTHACT